jgi:hypothetical protein
MYEAKHEPPLPRAHFFRRLWRHVALASGLLAGSLGFGMAGYRYFEGLPWLDSFLNASMLLGGMGPLEAPQTPGGKFFAGCYALYSGLFFLISAAIIFAPILHRLLHRFHWNERS